MKNGSLAVVGTGIQAPGQMTFEAAQYLKEADKVFYLVPDPFADRYIKSLNDTAEDLYSLYTAGGPRAVTYTNMVQTILNAVRKGQRVCAAFYGHPGVFAYPSHKAIHQAREEGYPAIMLPGVSAEDCIVSDLGLDPSIGCHSYEATSFLIRPTSINPACMLILWQIGVIGDLRYTPQQAHVAPGLEILAERLLSHYSEDHEVIVYEASFSAAWRPRVDIMKLCDLPKALVNGISTLVVPPEISGPVDDEMIDRLGMDREWLGKLAHSSTLHLYRTIPPLTAVESDPSRITAL